MLHLSQIGATCGAIFVAAINAAARRPWQLVLRHQPHVACPCPSLPGPARYGDANIYRCSGDRFDDGHHLAAGAPGGLDHLHVEPAPAACASDLDDPLAGGPTHFFFFRVRGEREAVLVARPSSDGRQPVQFVRQRPQHPCRPCSPCFATNLIRKSRPARCSLSMPPACAVLRGHADGAPARAPCGSLTPRPGTGFAVAGSPRPRYGASATENCAPMRCGDMAPSEHLELLKDDPRYEPFRRKLGFPGEPRSSST